jgi:hypothetical protein
MDVLQIIRMASVKPDREQPASDSIVVPNIVEPIIDDETLVFSPLEFAHRIVDGCQSNFLLQRESKIPCVARLSCSKALSD